MTDIQIDWPALRHEDGPPPWAAIDAAILATVLHLDTWCELADAFRKDFAEDEPRGFLSLYLPVILAEAAAAMPETAPQRTELADFLLTEMREAEVRQEDFVNEVLDYACGRMGPWILPLVLTHLQLPGAGGSIGLWALLHLVEHTPDTVVREAVARMCLQTVEAVANGTADLFPLASAVRVLAKLRHAAALPQLEPLVREKKEDLKKRLCWGEIRDAMEELRGEPVEKYPETWEKDMRTFVKQKHQQWQSWLADDSIADDPGTERDSMSGVRSVLAQQAVQNQLEPRNVNDLASWTPPQPYAREEPKIGRNDPCPCGSGKKYKKCCGK